MENKAGILELIDNFLTYLQQSREDIDELVGWSRDLANDADSALDDTDEAIDELVKLSELIEANEAEFDEGALRDLTGALLESRRDIASSLGEYQALLEHMEPASRALRWSSAAKQDVVDVVRRLQ